MIGWPLAADADILVLGPAGGDGHSQQFFDGRIALIEHARHHGGVPIQPQR